MSAYDPQSLAALMVAGATVGAFGWTVRGGIRRDRRDRDAASKQATQEQIDAAIRVERERQKLADAQDENAELRRQLRDRPDHS